MVHLDNVDPSQVVGPAVLIRADDAWLKGFDRTVGRRARVRARLVRLTPDAPVGSAVMVVEPVDKLLVLPAAPSDIVAGRAGDAVVAGAGKAALAFYGPFGDGRPGQLLVGLGEREIGFARHQPPAAGEPDTVTLRVALEHQLHGVRDVVFLNADNDADLEAVVLIEVMTGIGPLSSFASREAAMKRIKQHRGDSRASWP